MKAVTGLLPLAVVLLVVCALVGWLLDRGSSVGPWLVAVILFAHGWVHLVFLFPTPERGSAEADVDNPFDMGGSWLIGLGADGRLVRALGAVLVVTTFVAFVSAAPAVLGWVVPAAWWNGLTLAGVAGSAALLVLFYARVLVLGFVIDGALAALAVQKAWEVTR